MTDEPISDDSTFDQDPPRSDDSDIRAAFDSLRTDAHRLDLAAARRRFDGDAAQRRDPRRLGGLIPILVLVVIALAAVGAVAVASRSNGDDGVVADLPAPSGTTIGGPAAVDEPDPDATESSQVTRPEITDPTDGSSSSEIGDTTTESAFVPDPSLTWSVILVARDDTLNVRSGPGVGNGIVGELGPDATDIEAGVDEVAVGGETWRRVRSGSIEGWVNQRYLAASPKAFGADDVDAMAAQAAAAIGFLSGSDGALPPGWLSPEGVYIGGIGVYGDYPFEPIRVPAADLAGRTGWQTPIDFTPGDWDSALGPCRECAISPLDFINPPEAGRDRNYELDKSLTENVPVSSGFTNGPIESLDGMHHVTVDVPATSDLILDWQRIHLFFDFRTGTPLVHAIFTWGWTP